MVLLVTENKLKCLVKIGVFVTKRDWTSFQIMYALTPNLLFTNTYFPQTSRGDNF